MSSYVINDFVEKFNKLQGKYPELSVGHFVSKYMAKSSNNLRSYTFDELKESIALMLTGERKISKIIDLTGINICELRFRMLVKTMSDTIYASLNATQYDPIINSFQEISPIAKYTLSDTESLNIYKKTNSHLLVETNKNPPKEYKIYKDNCRKKEYITFKKIRVYLDDFKVL